MSRVVMLLSNGFSSDPRVDKEARALRVAGHEVTVLAWDRDGGLPVREMRGAYDIERLGPLAEYGAGLRSVAAFRAYWRRASARTIELGPDIVHCHDLDTYPAGAKAARASGASLVVDFHEAYRDSRMVPQSGVPGALARRVVGALERRAVARADAVLAATEGTADHYRRAGAGDGMTVVVNAPDADVFVPRPERRVTGGDALVVGFFGQKRDLSGLTALIDAIQLDDRLYALLAGGGTAEHEVASAASRAERVEVSGPFAYEELPGLYARCDVVFAVYDTAYGNWRTAFPVKVMEAMACGLPVICADGTWVGEYVRSHGVGVTVPFGDVRALADSLSGLREDPDMVDAMGERGRQIVEEGLNWHEASKRLLEVYERL